MKIRSDDRNYYITLENQNDIRLAAETFLKYAGSYYKTIEQYISIMECKEYSIERKYEKEVQYMLREQKLKRILEV